MKKLLVLAALTVAATPALASKARLSALGGAAHLIDTQTIFVNSADIHYLGDFATLEMGASDSTTQPHAEGGFVRSSGMGKWGAYLGRQSATVNDFVAASNAGLGAAYLMNENNSLDLMYGTELAGLKWGFGFHYSAAEKQTDAATLGNQKVGTMGASAGVRTDVWDAYLRFGLMGKSESDFAAAGTPELEQKGLIDIGGGYWMESMYVYAKYLTTKGTLTAAATETDIELNEYSIGAIDTVKVEGGSFFYGASYASSELKQGAAKTTTTGLPVIVGMELDATSWLVLRGSIQQTVLMGESKTDTTSDKLVNDTTVAAGAGLKFGKLTLDGTLAGTGTGVVNANNLLANASMTYMF